MNLQDTIIDPEFRDLLPAMDRRSELSEKIKAEGWTDEPITVWMNHRILLDGHNRYAIWQENGADESDGPQIRELKFDSREEAELWVRKHQDSRRNNTDEQKKYNLGRIYELEKKINGGAPRGNKNAAKQSPENLVIESDTKRLTNTTARRIGKEHGVSHDTVSKAGNYANAVDALDERGVINKADLLSGKVKVPASRVIQAAKAETPEEAKAVINNHKPKPKQEEKSPTSKSNEVVEATDKQHETAVSAVADACNLLQRSKLIRLSKNNPSRGYAFDEVIKWLKAMKKAD